MCDKRQVIEEPCEAKVSRTVLESGGSREGVADFNPRCGYISKKNRPNQGLTFKCECCGYTLHADLVGARNVAMRTLLVRQDWASTGILSGSRNVLT
jgi:hypothetical protein